MPKWFNLVSTQGVADYMRESVSNADWSHRARTVRIANGGRMPLWWFRTVFASGLATDVAKKWNQSPEKSYQEN